MATEDYGVNGMLAACPSSDYRRLTQREMCEIENMIKREVERRVYEQVYRPRRSAQEYSYRFDNSRFLPEPKKNMSLTTLAKKVLDSDLRAFIKAGIIDNDLEITTSGMKFLMAQYLSDNKKVLAKEARRKIREDKGKDEESEE